MKSKFKTYFEAMMNLRKAMIDLFLVLCEELKMDKLFNLPLDIIRKDLDQEQRALKLAHTNPISFEDAKSLIVLGDSLDFSDESIQKLIYYTHNIGFNSLDWITAILCIYKVELHNYKTKESE